MGDGDSPPRCRSRDVANESWRALTVGRLKRETLTRLIKVQQYAVAPDGRFLINVTVEEATASPITVVLNWTPKK